MKAKVVYRKIVVEEIEIDDKYYALTYEGGYDDLSFKEVDNLINEIIAEVEHKTEAHYHDIHRISTIDDEMLFES